MEPNELLGIFGIMFFMSIPFIFLAEGARLNKKKKESKNPNRAALAIYGM